MKVAIVSNVPAPYREPIFERISVSLSLLVIYQYMPEGRGWRVLKENTYPNVFDSAEAVLNHFRPDAVLVYGYSYRNALEGILWAIKRGVPLLMRTDSNIADDFYKPAWKILIKKILLEILTRRIRLFLSIGRRNTRYWLHYGADEEKIKTARYTVEVEFFSREAEKLRKRRKEILTALGLEDSRFILYSGRLVRAKGVNLLLEAFKKIAPSHRDVKLLICGDGPEKEKLQKMDYPSDRVIFTGNVPREKIVQFYAISELLVLPSYFEPWGLVVNEAMACGVPCVVSDVCGCVDDLILEGETGWTFKRGNAEDLAEKLKIALTSDLRSAGRNAMKISMQVTFDDVGEVFLEAFKEVCS